MAESIAYISPFPTLPNGQLVISLDIEKLSEYLQPTSEDSFVVDEEAQPFQVIIKSEVKEESKALEWLDAQQEKTEDLEPPIESLKKIVGLCLVASSPSSRFRRLQIEGSDDNAEVAMLDINELQKAYKEIPHIIAANVNKMKKPAKFFGGRDQMPQFPDDPSQVKSMLATGKIDVKPPLRRSAAYAEKGKTWVID